MFDFQDLQTWLAALRASPIFPFALPILVAMALASLADWMEHHLSSRRSTHKDEHRLCGRERSYHAHHAMPVSSHALKPHSGWSENP
jgi:hypothetical protein